MGKFLETQQMVAELVNIIKKSKGEVFIVSPYIKVPPYFKEKLIERNNKGFKTTIIYGKNEKLDPETDKFFKNLSKVTLKYKENLHAKCYISDEKIIIGSLNFYEYSITNNIELGILIDKSDEKELYDEILEEVNSIKENSQAKNNGFCIRTGQPIPFNIKKPMSSQAFKIWAEYADDEYQEKYCHFTGEKSNGETCMRNPIMRKNYKKARESFKF